MSPESLSLRLTPGWISALTPGSVRPRALFVRAVILSRNAQRINWAVQDRWILPPCENLNGDAISWSEICGSECIARLLFRKGFRSADEVQNFLRPRLSSLSDPFLLPQMRAAVVRILAALDRQERIVLFGDYDVDGVTSLALLDETLRAYSAVARPELFLPLRMEEGYGLSRESVERCLEQYRPQLLVALDCGTASTGEICRAQQARRGRHRARSPAFARLRLGRQEIRAARLRRACESED